MANSSADDSTLQDYALSKVSAVPGLSAGDFTITTDSSANPATKEIAIDYDFVPLGFVFTTGGGYADLPTFSVGAKAKVPVS